MVSENDHVSIQFSTSGNEAIGRNAILGARPCTLSSKICRFKFDVKICCSCSVRFSKSFLSFEISTSSGLQKNPSCFSVILSICGYFKTSNLVYLLLHLKTCFLLNEIFYFFSVLPFIYPLYFTAFAIVIVNNY